MAVKLNKMSRDELIQLRADIDKELKNVEEREKQEALKAAEDAVAKFGYSLSELTGGRGRKTSAKKAKAAAKYRNPDNASQTWSGLGRRPQWFHEAVNAGVDPKTLEI